jgi:hypothetical protein
MNSTRVLTKSYSSEILTSAVPSSTLLTQIRSLNTSVFYTRNSSSLMMSPNATSSSEFNTGVTAQTSTLELPYTSINTSKDVNSTMVSGSES